MENNSERGNALQYNLTTICENCGETLGDHKGWHCVKGPKYFKTVASTDYRGELLPK